jgi:hypothetical protein
MCFFLALAQAELSTLHIDTALGSWLRPVEVDVLLGVAPKVKSSSGCGSSSPGEMMYGQESLLKALTHELI